MPICRRPNQEELKQLHALYMEFYHDWTDSRVLELQPDHLDLDTLYIAVWEEYTVILPDSEIEYRGKVMSVIWPDPEGQPLHNLFVWHAGELQSVETCPVL